jgi:signal transduction histidine kinase
MRLPVRFGLRLQILLLLGGSMLLAFIPLFYAVATYTSVTLRQVRAASARSLGRAVAGHVLEAKRLRSEEALSNLLAAEVGSEGVDAVGVFDQEGRLTASAGPDAVIADVWQRVEHDREAVLETDSAGQPSVAVVVPDHDGAVLVVIGTDDAAAGAPPLVRLMGLYTGLFALGLLVLTYFALTRLIVRPLDELAHAAERVAAGARRLEIPNGGSPELRALGRSLRSMTERLLREEEALRRKIDEVEQATSRLKSTQDSLVRSERLASVGRLAAGLAHEIGNPISALIGLEELLLSVELPPDEQRDFIQRMRRETERIHRILRDLLEFARPTRNAAEPNEPGNVERAVHDTAALLSPQKALDDVELALDIEPDLPAVALSDEQLVQIVLNLVMNAADACGPGGHVEVSARRTANGVTLAVSDDGPGVSVEVRERLFEPFVTTKETGKGTGLGLAVCRGLVESVGGSVRLDTTAPAGARFVVDLPLSPAPAPPLPPGD